MPTHTNDVQSLIALVERQLAASGVRVVESEMLADRLTGELREIDICVHATVSGKAVTVALECRDHKRQADHENPDPIAPVERMREFRRDLTIDLDPYRVAVIEISGDRLPGTGPCEVDETEACL